MYRLDDPISAERNSQEQNDFRDIHVLFRSRKVNFKIRKK